MKKNFKLMLIFLVFLNFKSAFCSFRSIKDVLQKQNITNFLNKYPNIQFEEKLGKGSDKIIYSISNSNKAIAFFNNYEAFDREVEILKKLKHKNIIEIQDPEREYLSFYIDKAIMDLEVFLVLGRFKCKCSNILNLLKDVISGVKYIHEQGYVHRDLKPENILIFIDEQGMLTAKIIDFTLASKVDSRAPCCGSPRYIEPENFKLMRKSNNIKIRFEHDIYSLAIIFYKIFYLYFKERGVKDLNYYFRKNYLNSKDEGFFVILNEELIEGGRINLENECCRFPEIHYYISFIISKMWQPDLSERPTIQCILDYIEKVKISLTDISYFLQDPQAVYQECQNNVNGSFELELEVGCDDYLLEEELSLDDSSSLSSLEYEIEL